MNTPLRLMQRGFVALFLAIALVLQATSSVLAGTTGSISGTVVDSSSQKPIVGAKVTAASPSQTVVATTDSNGRFGFLSLAPDTYTLSVAASDSYDSAVVSGVTVQADQALQTSLQQPSKLKTIGKVTSRSASSLVKPGTTADVYSISAAQQDKASQVGGGGTLNSAFSALTTVPGVFVAPNQSGYIGAGPSLSIRGGDYDQIGYELDGVPVNRSFDNYPSSSLPSLGQQEVQVYTGASPANSEAEGLSGFVNQVIKTGSSPAYSQLTLGDGAPAFYHKFSIETGGANTSHTFSYYVGLGAYNQEYHYGDQFNGADISRQWGFPLAPCSGVPAANFKPSVVPSCFNANGTPYNTINSFVLGSQDINSQATTQQRDSVVNFHFGIPRKDGNRDDIQLLLDINHIGNSGLNSPNDFGGPSYLNAIGAGVPAYADGFQAQRPYGTLLAPGYTGGGGVVAPYFFPNSPTNRASGANIDPNTRDSFVNNQNVVKAQYQHNFGSNAYVRLYGYTSYSDWLQNGPNSAFEPYSAYVSSDYELSSHTRGVSLSFADQINAKNLLSFQSSYTTSSTVRYNNSAVGAFGPKTTVGYLVDGNNPYNGVAYQIDGTPVPGALYNPNGTAFGKLTIGQVLGGTAAVPAPGVTCGGGPCQYEIVAGGQSASYNTVKPKFYAFALTDDFRPSAKLDINVGIREDIFQFAGANTFNSGARTFFYNAYNSTAAARGVAPLPFSASGTGNINTYPIFEPRIGTTYTLDPTTVLRASYGRYAQAPNAAGEQYNYLQANDLASLAKFGTFGLPTTPGHDIKPPTSNNYDFSIEHQFGRDTALKLTPFLRKTQDQIQNFYLDQKTGFVSGLNVGNQTSQGVEFEVDKGDFARNGFAAKASFTYTNSYIRYSRINNGSSVVDPINAAISQFNTYTKAGGGSPYYSQAVFDPKTGAFVTAGTGSNTGGPGFVANPYYNAPLQGLLDPNGNFPTFSTFPGGITSVASTYGAPYVATLLLQYKHGPLALTPSLQFLAGQRYGIPENTPGILPDQIGGVLPGTAAGDPRYNFGSPGANGQPYDATKIGGTIPVPDLYTNRFDGLGQFVQPSFLQLNLQASYDLSKRVTLVATVANLYSSYFGGTKNGFTQPGAQQYGLLGQGGGAVLPTGNVYNPGAPVQPYTAGPYIPLYGAYPFGVFVEARVKI